MLVKIKELKSKKKKSRKFIMGMIILKDLKIWQKHAIITLKEFQKN